MKPPFRRNCPDHTFFHSNCIILCGGMKHPFRNHLDSSLFLGQLAIVSLNTLLALRVLMIIVSLIIHIIPVIHISPFVEKVMKDKTVEKEVVERMDKRRLRVKKRDERVVHVLERRDGLLSHRHETKDRR